MCAVAARLRALVGQAHAPALTLHNTPSQASVVNRLLTWGHCGRPSQSSRVTGPTPSTHALGALWPPSSALGRQAQPPHNTPSQVLVDKRLSPGRTVAAHLKALMRQAQAPALSLQHTHSQANFVVHPLTWVRCGRPSQSTRAVGTSRCRRLGSSAPCPSSGPPQPPAYQVQHSSSEEDWVSMLLSPT